MQGHVLHQNKASIAYMGKVSDSSVAPIAALMRAAQQGATGDTPNPIAAIGAVIEATSLGRTIHRNDSSGSVGGRAGSATGAGTTASGVTGGNTITHHSTGSSTGGGMFSRLSKGLGLAGNDHDSSRKRDNVLAELFRLDPDRLEEMLEDVTEGKVWKGKHNLLTMLHGGVIWKLAVANCSRMQ